MMDIGNMERKPNNLANKATTEVPIDPLLLDPQLFM
jgi:hypothetical protein